MKSTFVMIIIGILVIVPVLIVATRYFDGAFTDNTYTRSLNYDQSRNAAAKSSVIWSKPECSNGVCTMMLSVIPLPDNNSLSLRISHPTRSKEINYTLDYSLNQWNVTFSPDSSGWYIRRLDYTLYGTATGFEDSFYYR